MAIYVITHKRYTIIKKEYYIPLLVGAANKKEISQEYLRDDTGENISKRNDAYCELTGLYWIWKNTRDDIVGLVHYRRYFAHVRGLRYRSRYFVMKKDKSYKLLTFEEAKKILNSYDIIVKISQEYSVSNEVVFRRHRHIGDANWEILEFVIRTMHEEYMHTFEYVSKQKRHINCNMFIADKSLADKYCEWLFAVLREIDDIYFTNKGERYHSRELGYFAEILFEVWLRQNNVHYYIADAINISSDDIEDGMLHISAFPLYIIKHILISLHCFIFKTNRIRS